jgi:hypothetical protein
MAHDNHVQPNLALDDMFLLALYNASGFRIETIYDYYIVMKSTFLVVKLSSTLLLVM